jgi:hypothetical protein
LVFTRKYKELQGGVARIDANSDASLSELELVLEHGFAVTPSGEICLLPRP